MAQWTPPPNWPRPAPGWAPPPGWQPDPSWGPEPPGWDFYPEDDRRGKNKRTLKVAGSLLALLLVGSCVAGVAGDDGSVARGEAESASVDVAGQSETPSEAAAAQKLVADKAAADKAEAEKAAAAKAAADKAAAAKAAADKAAADKAAAAKAEAVRVEAERVAAAAAAAEAARVEAERVAAAAQAAEEAASAVYYANCDAVRAAGAAPIYANEPGYSTKLDRDRDGIGCDT